MEEVGIEFLYTARDTLHLVPFFSDVKYWLKTVHLFFTYYLSTYIVCEDVLRIGTSSTQFFLYLVLTSCNLEAAAKTPAGSAGFVWDRLMSSVQQKFCEHSITLDVVFAYNVDPTNRAAPCRARSLYGHGEFDQLGLWELGSLSLCQMNGRTFCSFIYVC